MPSAVRRTFAGPGLAPADVLTALGDAGFEIGPPVAASRVLLDTFDGRLHDAGLRLVLDEHTGEERAGTDRALVLTGPAGSPPARLTWTRAAPAMGMDLPPGPFGSRVAARTLERALLPVVDLTSTTNAAIVRDRRDKAVVHLLVHGDLGSTTDPAVTLPTVVVEISPVVGHEADGERVAEVLGALGLDRHDGDVLDLALAAAGRSAAGHSASPTVPLSPGDDALDAFRDILRNLLASVLVNLPGTLDDLDPEFLHELRVAVRRTRSVLAQGRKVIPKDVRRRYREVFGELGEATGRTRDLDVYVLGWADMTSSLEPADREAIAPLLTELEARRVAAHRAMSTILDGAATRAALAEWQAWLDDPEVSDHDAGPLGPFVAGRIADAQDALLTNGRAIDPGSPAEALHDLRKDAKKLRYLLECFGSLFPTKGRKSFVNQLKALQDNLGEFQDLEVQVAELRDLAAALHETGRADAPTLLAVGRLIDHLERARQRERDEFADRFAAYDAPGNRTALDRLLAKVAAS